MECSIENKTSYDLDGLIGLLHKFIPYAQKFLQFDKSVTIELLSDLGNAKDLLGKTAYYTPMENKISIFTDNRHAKDILRSISHELVHHAQQCRGEFDEGSDTDSGYIVRDEHMQNMEGEAYLLGNGFIVRFFEEFMKTPDPDEPHHLTRRKPITEQITTLVNDKQEDDYYTRREEFIAKELLRRIINGSI